MLTGHSLAGFFVYQWRALARSTEYKIEYEYDFWISSNQ